jgi:hypothetical protein
LEYLVSERTHCLALCNKGVRAEANCCFMVDSPSWSPACWLRLCYLMDKKQPRCGGLAVFERTQTHSCARTRIHTHAHAHKRTYTHTYTCTHTHAFTHVSTHTHMLARTRTHTCTHTRKYTYTLCELCVLSWKGEQLRMYGVGGRRGLV